MSSVPLFVVPQQSANIDILPRLMHELSEIQRYVLARAAIHSWQHGGLIPFVPPTAHQASIATSLAAPGVRLLVGVAHRPAFLLSRLGERVIPRFYQVVATKEDAQQEIEFDFLAYLMRNKWETCG